MNTIKLSVFCTAVVVASALQIVPKESVPINGTPVTLAPTRTATNGAVDLNDANQFRLVKTVGTLPMRFEANRGQADAEVQLLSRGRGYSLLLKRTEVVLALQNGTRADKKNRDLNDPGTRTELRMRLVGGNPDPKVEPAGELITKSHYFIGRDRTRWQTNVPNYGRAVYHDVYPGIDLQLYGNQGQLEYDFVVAPDSDPDVITMSWEGADDLAIAVSGTLRLRAGGGDVLIQPPVAYQEIDDRRQRVPSRFVSRGADRVGFEIGDYDRSKPLVIDPVLSYATFLGGSGIDSSADVAVDAKGNVYLTGTTASADFPTLSPLQTYQGSDAFIVKLDPTGATVVYSTYVGGGGFDAGMGIAVDRDGNASMMGVTTSDDFPTANAVQNTLAVNVLGNGQDAFVTQLNPTGSDLVYSTYLGGTDTELAGDGGIAVDTSGNVYVTGDTFSTDFPIANAFQPSFGGGSDVFVSKFSSGGSLSYSSYYGGAGFDGGRDVAVDALGSAHVTGRWNDRLDDAIVLKVNATGTSLDRAIRLTADEGTAGTGIALDTLGNIYVTGITLFGFPTVNAVQQDPGGLGDAFVAKLSPDFFFVYSTFLGGSREENGLGTGDWHGDIAVDRQGNAYVTGSTSSEDFPTVDALQTAFGGTENPDLPVGDAFVAKLSPSGSTLTFSTYLGGMDDDQGNGIAVDALGNIYVTGWTHSTDFPTANPLQGELRGPESAFITKIGSERPLREGEVWQIVKFPGEFELNTEAHTATFIKKTDGPDLMVQGEIVEVSSDTIQVRVPVGLLGERAGVLFPPPERACDTLEVRIDVARAGQDTTHFYYDFKFWYPFWLIYDQVTVTNPLIFPNAPAVNFQQILLQYLLRDEYDVATFVFVGRRTDGTAALRLINTRPFPPPLNIVGVVFAPSGEVVLTNSTAITVGSGSAGFHFPVSQDGLYVIVVSAQGTFPSPFQIHLAGDVSAPRKFVDGVREFPRATRQDILFNHSAPRQQPLLGRADEIAQTGLFKFVNPTENSEYAVAVLVPPDASGFADGSPIRRAPDPPQTGLILRRPVPIQDITTPTARSPVCMPDSLAFHPLILGTVVDFTQVPVPASVEVQPTLAGTVCAAIGRDDRVGVTLPIPVDTAPVYGIILDMGSGQEIVDGPDADFTVLSTAGTYQVAVANTPYARDFSSIAGAATGEQSFDLTGTGLSSARYVRIAAAPEATIDAIQALNMMTDAVRDSIPVAQLEKSTILMRRAKAPETIFDPWLELIGPDGTTLDKGTAGFGDQTSVTRTDAALVNTALIRQGAHRFLGRGYDLTPDEQSYGTYYVRLESGGDYDPVDVTVSSLSEAETQPQRIGTISDRRQRDSYVFQATPGQALNISVHSLGPDLDPLVELYDPEGLLIAASDNFPTRGDDALVVVEQLPLESAFGGGLFPAQSTYRVVVSAVDRAGERRILPDYDVFLREAAVGDYELKVFTGEVQGGFPSPRIGRLVPDEGVQGDAELLVSIFGSDFMNGTSVEFGGDGISVNAVEVISAARIDVTIGISQFAATGARDVTVTRPDGKSATATDAFDVVTGGPIVGLFWNSPVTGAGLAPPTDLSARPGSESSKLSTAGRGVLECVTQIVETEPNDNSSDAQAVGGESSVCVTGSLTPGADENDTFKLGLTADGLIVRLDAFSSDLDMELQVVSDLITFVIGESANVGDTVPEIIDRPNLVIGDYWVSVNLVGVNATDYTLTLDGAFDPVETGDPVLEGYRVYRSTVEDPFSTGSMIAETDASTTSFVDMDVERVMTYFYQTTAVYDQGESPPSNQAEVNVPSGTDISVSDGVAIFSLRQNYPNPFNPTTTISYDLPWHAEVTLAVYDVLGRQVQVLAIGARPAGTYEVSFDATTLPSGIYFYRLQAGNLVEAKRMVVIK